MLVIVGKPNAKLLRNIIFSKVDDPEFFFDLSIVLKTLGSLLINSFLEFIEGVPKISRLG